MDYFFSAALERLGGAAGLALYAAEAAVPADYLLNTILPNEIKNDYSVQSGGMTIFSTMAGLVGMDSPYPVGGMVTSRSLAENTGKLAIHVPLTEASIRDLQATAARMQLAGATADATNERLAQAALNFYDKIILQAIYDAQEYMKGRALGGTLNWANGNIVLNVNYGIPANNILPAATGANGYGGATSQFWADNRRAAGVLSNRVTLRLATSSTILAILNNDANRILVESEDLLGTTVLRRVVGNNDRTTGDTRDRVSLVAYDRTVSVLDPSNPTQLVTKKVLDDGKIYNIGLPILQNQYRVGDDALAAANRLRLGYGHVAPTTENKGAPGVWGRLFIPENAQMQLHGQAVSNFLPVLENPTLVAIQTTEMPA